MMETDSDVSVLVHDRRQISEPKPSRASVFSVHMYACNLYVTANYCPEVIFWVNLQNSFGRVLGTGNCGIVTENVYCIVTVT